MNVGLVKLTVSLITNGTGKQVLFNNPSLMVAKSFSHGSVHSDLEMGPSHESSLRHGRYSRQVLKSMADCLNRTCFMKTLLPQIVALNDGPTGGHAENVLEGWPFWIVDFLEPLAEFPGTLH